MNFEQYALLGLVLAGVTELLNRLRAKDYWVVASILTCVAVGAIAGFLDLFGVPSVETGIIVGFGTSGALKTVSAFGNKSTPSPSKVLVTDK